MMRPSLTKVALCIALAICCTIADVIDVGISLWRARVPAYLYLSPPDGPLPGSAESLCSPTSTYEFCSVPPPRGPYTTETALRSFWYNADGKFHYVMRRPADPTIVFQVPLLSSTEDAKKHVVI